MVTICQKLFNVGSPETVNLFSVPDMNTLNLELIAPQDKEALDVSEHALTHLQVIIPNKP